MIRFPPTSITLCEDDLDHHLKQILLRHGLVPEFQYLRLDHDDNSFGSEPAQLDSYPSSPRVCPSSGSSNSDSGLGFDSVLMGKLSEGNDSRGNSNASVPSSGCSNTADAIEVPGPTGSSLDIVPITSVDSRNHHSLFVTSCLDQHKGPHSVISHCSPFLSACLHETHAELREGSTLENLVSSQLQYTEQCSLELSFSSLSLRVSADSDCASPAEEHLGMLPQETKGSENQRISFPQPEESNNVNREAEAFPATLPPLCSVDPGIRLNDTSGKNSPLEAGSMAESTTNTEIFHMFGAPVIKRESMDVIGLETDQLIASPSRTRRTPRSEKEVSREYRTIMPSHAENSSTPATANSSPTQNSPSETNQNSRAVSETETNSVTSDISSTVLDWTDTRHSPCRIKTPLGLSSSSSRASSFPSSEPSLGHVLAESKKLRRYFRAMVADLGYVDGPDGLRRRTFA